MPIGLTNSKYYKEIADAIREKGGADGALSPAQMAEAILAIKGGGGTMVYISTLEPTETDVGKDGDYWFVEG